MTPEQFASMIQQVESGSAKKPLQARGDSGLACGAFQQHWDFRIDNWPPWAWELLYVVDKMAVLRFAARNSHLNARELARLYNLGHPGVDPEYENKCRVACIELAIPLLELDKQLG